MSIKYPREYVSKTGEWTRKNYNQSLGARKLYQAGVLLLLHKYAVEYQCYNYFAKVRGNRRKKWPKITENMYFYYKVLHEEIMLIPKTFLAV